ncbi:Uncharacterised protein [Acinetobacter nosocomialis]|nr:Uncharacterised protein [Acinetobacter nosocomialis]
MDFIIHFIGVSLNITDNFKSQKIKDNVMD